MSQSLAISAVFTGLGVCIKRGVLPTAAKFHLSRAVTSSLLPNAKTMETRGLVVSFFNTIKSKNKKKQSSTLSPMPSNETVKQELKIIAGALFKGSQFSGSESFMIKTPALAALHDEGRFTRITNMSTASLSHHVAKWLNVHLTIYTLIYVLNELNIGQNRNEENSLVFKAMRSASCCQGNEHFMQSVVDCIMAAATAADDEVLEIAPPPTGQR